MTQPSRASVQRDVSDWEWPGMNVSKIHRDVQVFPEALFRRETFTKIMNCFVSGYQITTCSSEEEANNSSIESCLSDSPCRWWYRKKASSACLFPSTPYCQKSFPINATASLYSLVSHGSEIFRAPTSDNSSSAWSLAFVNALNTLAGSHGCLSTNSLRIPTTCMIGKMAVLAK